MRVGHCQASPLWGYYFVNFSIWPLGQAVKTPPFHGGNTGSSPVGVTILDMFAGVAELADAPDLGSGAARRGGSTPFTRTIYSNTSATYIESFLIILYLIDIVKKLYNSLSNAWIKE